jgi:hypothetical protein
MKQGTTAEDRLSMVRPAGAAAPTGQDRAPGGAVDERAAIVIVDRDADGQQTLYRELSGRYGGDYRIVVCGEPAALEDCVRKLVAAGAPVALVIGGVGAADTDGIDVLAGVRAIDPTVSRGGGGPLG